jgi:hypothetical protein
MKLASVIIFSGYRCQDTGARTSTRNGVVRLMLALLLLALCGCSTPVGQNANPQVTETNKFDYLNRTNGP